MPPLTTLVSPVTASLQAPFGMPVYVALPETVTRAKLSVPLAASV
ncbi:hypothetical protein SCYAM73S_06913 [Streptomyces cyaneofuscatus]